MVVARSDSRSRRLVAALESLLVAALLLTVLPAMAGAASSASNTPKARTTTEKAPNDSYSYSSDHQDGRAEVDAWTFSRDHGHWRNTNGPQDDWDEAQKAIDDTEGDIFWFRRGDDQYVVTDPATMKELAEIFAPQEELGKRQGALGARQGELGRIQGQLGRRQGDLGRIQAKLSQRQAVAQVARVSRDRGDDDTDALEVQMSEIQRLQNEAGVLQAELGEEQSRLGERQAALGEQQAALGREQARVSKQVSAALDKLRRELIANGKARRLSH